MAQIEAPIHLHLNVRAMNGEGAGRLFQPSELVLMHDASLRGDVMGLSHWYGGLPVADPRWLSRGWTHPPYPRPKGADLLQAALAEVSQP